MGRVTLRCYGELGELAGADRDGLVDVPVGAARSIRDVTASVGIPSTEIDLVVVNGISVGWEHQVVAGQRVAVYPPFSTLPAGVVSRVRTPPPEPLRFAADAHLARLAALLQDLGHDTWHATDVTADQLAERASTQERVLLSRDPRPLMHPGVVHGVLLHSSDPREQLLEVARRYGLSLRTRRHRCT